MGILAWIAIGIMIPVAGRLMARALDWHRDPPGIGAGLAGSILGGFLTDLTIRGDSVLNLNATTLVGALLGAVLVLASGYRLARSTATSRRTT